MKRDMWFLWLSTDGRVSVAQQVPSGRGLNEWVPFAATPPLDENEARSIAARVCKTTGTEYFFEHDSTSQGSLRKEFADLVESTARAIRSILSDERLASHLKPIHHDRKVEDIYGRIWYSQRSEACKKCGQPDSVGDCNHRKLSNRDVLMIGGQLPDDQYPILIDSVTSYGKSRCCYSVARGPNDKRGEHGYRGNARGCGKKTTHMLFWSSNMNCAYCKNHAESAFEGAKQNAAEEKQRLASIVAENERRAEEDDQIRAATTFANQIVKAGENNIATEVAKAFLILVKRNKLDEKEGA
jgi:hypothetical protein